MRNGVMMKAHRYVWEQLVAPIAPGMVLDHICFVPQCVNPSHLRVVTQKQNSEHLRGATKASTTGVRNVFRVSGGKYVVQIRHNRKLIHIGTYVTLDDAAEAAQSARARIFTHAD